MDRACNDVSPAEAERLHRFEAGLNPGEPERSAQPPKIIGYGEVSTTFVVPGLPDLACKRMAGFRNEADARAYLDVVARYVARLEAIGVGVVETRALYVKSPHGWPIVYLVQPLLDENGLGHRLLLTAPDTVLFACIDRVLEYAIVLHHANQQSEDEIAVDAQLSNWHFIVEGDRVAPPKLLDVGTPFMRNSGRYELDTRFLLAPVPQPLRWYYRRQRAVEKYLDDYFDPRKLIVDLVCNFHKEGRPERIPAALEHINAWLETHAPDLRVSPISPEDVARYYAQDVASLELYMRVRRVDRFVRTRLLRQRYRFTLPGPVKR